MGFGIRGTKNIKNIYYDLKTKKIIDDKLSITLHEGFYDIVKLLYAESKQYLKKDYHISLTGHSLGGAVVAIMSLYMQHDGYNIDQVITFGQPKITTKKYIKQLDDKVPLIRIVDNGDIVPFLPLLEMSTNNKQIADDIKKQELFWHFGSEVILYKDYFSYLTTHDAERLSNNSLLLNLPHVGIKNHHMKKYLKNIDNIIRIYDKDLKVNFHDYMSTF